LNANRAAKESSLAKRALPAKNAKQVPFKIKVHCQVCLAGRVQQDGSNQKKVHRRALISIGKRKKPAKKQSTSTTPHPIHPNGRVNPVQPVVIAPTPLILKPLDQNLDGGKYRKTKEILRRMQCLQNVCFHPRASVAATQIYLIGTQKQQPFQPRIPL